jgi:hypothetical protein
VEGTIHLKSGDRLKAELNEVEKLIAIMNARVMESGSNQLVYEPEVLIVHKSQIVWIFARDTTNEGRTACYPRSMLRALDAESISS